MTKQEKKSDVKTRKKKTLFPYQAPKAQPRLEKNHIDFRTPTKVMTRASAKNSQSSTISPSTEAVMLQKVPKFLQLLFQMLKHESDEIIAWSNQGHAFQVKDIKQLEASVLPKYFKHQKMSSFQRQLNYFSFRKLTKSKTNTCTFTHPYFCEHQPQKLSMITKKNCASGGAALFSPEKHHRKSAKKAPASQKRPSNKAITIPQKTSTSSMGCSSTGGEVDLASMIQDKENQPPRIEHEEQDFSFYNMNSLLTSENQMTPFHLTENLPDQPSTGPLNDPQQQQQFLPSRSPMMNGDIFMLHHLTNNVSTPHAPSTAFWSDALLDFDLSLTAADFL